MGQIKFRAWCPLSGEKMIYDGFAVNAEGKAMYVGYDNYGFDGDEVVMQYTGLHDRHGKEIYEGDIIRANGGEGQVVFLNGMFGMDFGEEVVYAFDKIAKGEVECEVIGNIYENYELLK